MLLDLMKRMGAWRRGRSGSAQTSPARGGGELPFAALLGETSWHGDHWANLLSSPMDARHYVLEDWSTPRPAGAFDA
jgi:hypothetical protein